jgi:hypothetical protein
MVISAPLVKRQEMDRAAFASAMFAIGAGSAG